MSRDDKIIELVTAMSEEKAKENLAEIFLRISGIGFGSYTDEKCFHDIKKIYMKEIVAPQVHKIQENI